MPHREEEHWECRARSRDRRWMPLYIRKPGPAASNGRMSRTFVRVGQVCPACGRTEGVREGLADALS